MPSEYKTITCETVDGISTANYIKSFTFCGSNNRPFVWQGTIMFERDGLGRESVSCIHMPNYEGIFGAGICIKCIRRQIDLRSDIAKDRSLASIKCAPQGRDALLDEWKRSREDAGQ